MTLSERLRKARGDMSQRQVAEELGAPRELISMWETNARAPSDQYLRHLARVYSVSYGWLSGQETADTWKPEAVLFRKTSAEPASAERRALDNWLAFLDRWAERLPDLRLPGASVGRGLRKPPKPLNVGGAVRDARRAPTLAAMVREYLRVGDGPLPDLYALLDAFGVLVYRSDELTPVGGDGVVSGAFLNHTELGFCVFVNVRCSPGRQAFTLAHELAHALFHYPERATVSRQGDRAQEERFANAFASHLLVPGRELTRLSKQWLAGTVTAYGAIQLAAHFRVSYAMMLYRLADEGLVTKGQVREWRSYSPVGMAVRLGLPTEGFCPTTPSEDEELDRFPLSVRNAVQRALSEGVIQLSQAADILDVDESTLESDLPPPGTRSRETEQELSEYPASL